MTHQVLQALQSEAGETAAPEQPPLEPVPAPRNPEDTIAAVLLNAGLLTPQQLMYAKRVRAKLSTPKTLLNVLKELRYVTNEQIQHALSSAPTEVPLGDLMVELGYLQHQELETALNLQRESSPRKKLGEILLEQRFVDGYKLAEVLSYQLGWPYVEPQFSTLDRSLLGKGALQKYAELCFLPLYKQDGHVVVAFSDPLDLQSRELAAKLFGWDLLPVITRKEAILNILEFCTQTAQETRTIVADESSVVGLVHAMFLDALQDNASDIHLEPMHDRLRVRFRCDGVLVQYKDFPPEVAPAMSSRIKILAKADIAEKRRHQDGRILFEDPHKGTTIDMRASFYVTIHGEKIVLRLLNKKGELLDISELGMAPRMLERFRDDALDVPSGVVIITGPTGSGKTTTLYSCVNHLNDTHTSIITAEDPVEYVIDGIAQCSINPKINVTFEETLRHIVRQDPDIIVLGEIRDRFSAETAIQAALTGHKVLTTFHTEDSIGGLLRLLNMEIEAFLISSTVVCVVAQRLLRRVCRQCAEPYRLTLLDLRQLGADHEMLRGGSYTLGRGCKYCRFTGYRGRVGVFELLILNEVVKDAILNRKTSYEIRRLSLESSGLVTLVEDGLVKAATGETSITEVIRQLPRLHKPRPLQQLQRLLGGV
jgi:type IV pilus assembly protein PilB